MEKTAHWTSRSVDAFIHRITFDFLTQLSKRLDSSPMNQADLAKELNTSESSVSQVLNNPRNLTLRTIVKYARALGLKVALVAYDDGDHDNNNGPINSDIFRICWERQEKPTDFWALNEAQPTATPEESVIVPAESGSYILPPMIGGRRHHSHRGLGDMTLPTKNAADRFAEPKEGAHDDADTGQVFNQIKTFANLGGR